MRGTNDPDVARHWTARGLNVYPVVIGCNTNVVEQTDYLVAVKPDGGILFGTGGNDSDPVFWVASKLPSLWGSDDYPG